MRDGAALATGNRGVLLAAAGRRSDTTARLAKGPINVKDRRFVKAYPSFSGVNSSQSGNPSHYFGFRSGGRASVAVTATPARGMAVCCWVGRARAGAGGLGRIGV